MFSLRKSLVVRKVFALLAKASVVNWKLEVEDVEDVQLLAE